MGHEHHALSRLDQLVSELEKERENKKNQSTKGKLQKTRDRFARSVSVNSHSTMYAGEWQDGFMLQITKYNYFCVMLKK